MNSHSCNEEKTALTYSDLRRYNGLAAYITQFDHSLSYDDTNMYILTDIKARRAVKP